MLTTIATMLLTNVLLNIVQIVLMIREGK